MKEKNNRNGAIEFWRFILIIAIGIMHFSNSYYGASPYLGGAYVATEFFFLVSGYLLMASFLRNKERKETISAWRYTVRKIKNLYPCYLLSFLALFCFIMINDKVNLMEWFTNLGQSVWELMFLQISGLKGFRLFNYPAWYISAMLIAGYFIYALLEVDEKRFVKILMPLSILIIYTNFSKNAGNIDVWGGAKILDISDALMRAFAGMSLGGLSCYAARSIQKRVFSNASKYILSVLELMAFLLAFCLMNQVGHTQTDFYIIFLFFLGITLSFSNQTFTAKVFSMQLFQSLGKISYPMFLNQILVISIIGTYVTGLPYRQGVILFLIILLIISAIEVLLLKLVSRLKNQAFGVRV